MFSNWTAKKKSEMILLCCCAFVSFRLVLSDSAANLRAKVMWCVAIYGFTNSNPSLLLIYTLFDSDSSNAFYLHKCSQSIFSSDTLILHFFYIYLFILWWFLFLAFCFCWWRIYYTFLWNKQFKRGKTDPTHYSIFLPKPDTTNQSFNCNSIARKCFSNEKESTNLFSRFADFFYHFFLRTRFFSIF